MGDENRKTLRSFYCRDYLWDLYEVMTRDLGCSMDYLVNEAMRHYARNRNYSFAAGQRPGEQPEPASVPAPASRRPPPPLPGQPTFEATRTLYLVFNQQRYRIENDEFVIGRGQQGTDLMIRDGNISRRHCIIARTDTGFVIKDLGSTNGIEFNGERVGEQHIEDGDIFYLCDYELRFTYA